MQQDDSNLDVAAVVNELEIKLDRLKILYEQYFMGIAKREPLVPLKDVVRLVHALEQVQIRNTGLRFKLRTLVQRFNVYRTYWNRTMRAINNGTYHRDVARVSRKLSEQGVSLSSTGRVRSVAELEQALTKAYQKQQDEGQGQQERKRADQVRGAQPAVADEEAPTTNRPAVANGGDEAPTGIAPAAADRVSANAPTRLHAAVADDKATKLHPRVAATPRPQAGANGDISDREIQSIYRRFIKAKQICGEDTAAVRYESLAKSIRQQLPKIRQQNPGKEVEFQVVLRNGRAIIRAKTS